MKRTFKKTAALLLALLLALPLGGWSLFSSGKGWHLEDELDKFGDKTGASVVVCSVSGKNSLEKKFTGTVSYNAYTFSIRLKDNKGEVVVFYPETCGEYSVSVKTDRGITEQSSWDIHYYEYSDSVIIGGGGPVFAAIMEALYREKDAAVMLSGESAPTYTFTVEGKGFPKACFNRADEFLDKRDYHTAKEEFELLQYAGYAGSEAKISACDDGIYGPDYQKAKALFDSGEFEKAEAMFIRLGSYSDSEAQVANCIEAINNREYNAAKALYEKGEFEKAQKAFEALGGYSDSEAQVSNCIEAIKNREYNAAKALYEKGEFEKAQKAFEALGGYNDSKLMVKYASAKALYDKKDYAGAYAAFLNLKGYKDVDSLLATDDNLKAAAAARDAAYQPGKYVKFGAYEQDNNASDGKEAVEWLVLAREGNKALLISRYVLDCKPYNEKYVSVTWEKCTLRTWLNDTFLQNCFTSAEQNSIVTSKVSPDENPSYFTYPGNATNDKVFLLSIPEVEKYFSSDSARQCRPTEYAKKQGVYAASDGYVYWWLRSPGINSIFVAYVLGGGGVDDFGGSVDSAAYAVRPALWVDIS